MTDGCDSLRCEVLAMGEDIISSSRFAKAEHVIHHSRELNIAAHSVDTAVRALEVVRWLNRHGADANEVDAVRAALLHDIGMTEDGVASSPSPAKARLHPLEGAHIAREEFGANDVQVDAIRHHMWPLCLVPPRSVEGWVVVAADKHCSTREAVRIVGSMLRSKLRNRDREDKRP